MRPRAPARAFRSRPGETLDALLARLDGPFFDPSVDPLVTSKTPGKGRDILTASANNLYESVTMSDLEGFEERYGLNSRLVKRDGQLEEEVYRSSGRYGAQIREVVRHLRAALPHATAPMRRALEALIAFYESGEDADRVAYDEAWVDDKDSPVDTINGFIENYLDARGVKGAWEGIVCLREPREERRLAPARRGRAVVRGADAVGSEVPARGRHRRHRPRHRRRRRDRRSGAGDGDRDQSAERPADSRGARQQVGVAREHQRGVRQVRSRRRSGASSAGPRRKSRARRSGARSRARS